MKTKGWLSALGLSMICLSGSIHAQNLCDCSQYIGRCSAQIEMKSRPSGNGLWGADLTFRANAPACARIDYYVGSTPRVTMLTNGKSGRDQIMATAREPISPSSVSLESCRVCITASQVNAENAKREADEAAQAEIDRLVDNAVNSGALDDPHGRNTDSMADTMNALQQTLTVQQVQQQRAQQALQEQQRPQQAQQQYRTEAYPTHQHPTQQYRTDQEISPQQPRESSYVHCWEGKPKDYHCGVR